MKGGKYSGKKRPRKDLGIFERAWPSGDKEILHGTGVQLGPKPTKEKGSVWKNELTEPRKNPRDAWGGRRT